jgi:hypothetical protein
MRHHGSSPRIFAAVMRGRPVPWGGGTSRGEPGSGGGGSNRARNSPSDQHSVHQHFRGTLLGISPGLPQSSCLHGHVIVTWGHCGDLEGRNLLHAGRSGCRAGFAALNYGLEAMAN